MLGQATRDYYAFKQRVKDAKDNLELMEQELLDLEERAILVMEKEGMNSVKFDNGFGRNVTLYQRTQHHVSIDNVDAFKGWCKKQGVNFDDLKTVHPSKLKGICTELRNANDPLPDGVNDFTHAKLGVRHG